MIYAPSVALALILAVSARAQQAPEWKLSVTTGSNGKVSAVTWERDARIVAAVTPKLLALIAQDPARLLRSAAVPHALVCIPFNHPAAPLGEVVPLAPGEQADLPAPGEGLLGAEPVAVALSRWGFFFTRESGRRFTVGHYDLKTRRIENLADLDAAEVGRVHRVDLSPEAATVTSGGRAVAYRPGGRRPEPAVRFHELGIGNIDVIEGKLGGVDLTQKAIDGFLDPDESEEELTRRVAELLKSNRDRRSVLLWGATGVDLRGIVHLLAKRIAGATESDPSYGWFKGWKVYQVPWSRLNTEGLVDVAIQKTAELVEAARQKKVILHFDQMDQLVGLGSNSNRAGDVSSVLTGHLKTGEILVLGTTGAEGIAQVRSKPEFLRQFNEISVSPPSGERLLVKLRGIATRRLESRRVSFPEGVLKKVVEVTDRYLPDEGQPQKSLAAIETMAVELSPLRGEETDREAVEPRTATVADVMAWISRTARIGTLEEDRAEGLIRFILSDAFEREMAKRLVGQGAAVRALRDALLSIARGDRSTNALGAEVGIEALLFTGPSGTGKSFVHEVLSKVLGEKGIPLPYEEPIEGSTLVDGDQAIRTLIGAAPGFTGYDATGEGGLLYKMVKRSPQAILVLEEFDKVHEDVDKILYSFLDTAKVQNSSGRVARFTRGLFLLTANYGVEGSRGATARRRGGGILAGVEDNPCDLIDRWDRHHLFPEGDALHRADPLVAPWDRERLRVELFNCLKDKRLVNAQILGRIGRSNLVVFHHFTREEIVAIRDQQLAGLGRSHAASHDARVEFTADLRQALLDLAWGPDGRLAFATGARSIVDAVKSEARRAMLRFAAEQGNRARGKAWIVDWDQATGTARVSFSEGGK